MPTTSTALWIVMIALYAAGIGGGLWAAVQLERFLRATPAIDNIQALEWYKSLARRNMYLALTYVPVLGTGGIMGLVLIWMHGLSAPVGILALNALLLLSGKYVSRKESAARNLPVSDDLSREYDRVSRSWTGKMLPDF